MNLGLKFGRQRKSHLAIAKQSSSLYVAKSHIHGRGVFSSRTIKPGVIFEKCPIIKIKLQELALREYLVLNYYSFMIDEKNGDTGFVLGYGSLYNHSADSNSMFYFDEENELMVFESRCKIQEHEEITINYLGLETNVNNFDYWLQKPGS